MTKLRYFSWLLCFLLCALAHAQITAIGGAGCTIPGASSSCTANAASVNVNAGDTVIAVFHSNQQAVNPTISGCGITWPAPVVDDWVANPGRLRIWAVTTTAASTGCNVNVSPTTGSNAFAFQVYRGVLSIGTPDVRGGITNSATFNTNAITSGNAGNWIVGLYVSSTPNLSPFTAVGNTQFRRGPSGVTLASAAAIADIPATAAGQSLTVSISPNVSGNYRAAAIELTGAPANRPAQLGDAMQTIVMNASHSMNYVLPTNGLSATWCTWFMPTGPATNNYELEPGSSIQVNGQASHIRIPSWQMTRICQDQQGHFWASPPLLPGSGISLTPAPTGITIAATGGGGGNMAYIAGGTTHIPGNVTVQPDSCTTLYTSDAGTDPSASGVQQSDVVSWSLQPSASAWNNGKTYFHAIAYAGSITWRGCNLATSAYTPSARDVNWYVIRPSAGVLAIHAKHHPVKHKPVARPKK